MTEDDKRLYKAEAEAARKAVVTHCEYALVTMERFLNEAKREVGHAKDDSALAELPNRLLHALAWGLANASGEMETAIVEALRLAKANGVLKAEDLEKPSQDPRFAL